MSDNVRDVQESTLVDLFPELSGKQQMGSSFGSADDVNTVDLFASTTETTTAAPVSTTETTTAAPASTEPKEGDGNADILGEGGNKPGRKPKYDFSDISGYFQDRIKNGKFVKIEEVDDKGNKIEFLPKTPEEFDEVIDIQVNHRLEAEKKSLEEKWYSTKSPAWQLVGKYAEMVDDPSQLVPFIQGVRNIQTVQNIDEAEVEGAEQIVRLRLEQRGEPESVITSQVESLKAAEKLVSTAKELKPIMVQQEQQALAMQMRQAQQQEAEYNQLVSELREEAIKAIEQPIFGKQKLKQEEKFAVYNLIGEPADEQGGYGIYSAIDQLFDKKDFETLKQVALLLAKKDSFYGYFGSNVANTTASTLQKQLRVAGDSRASSSNDTNVDDDRPTVTRNQFKSTPRFGRG